MSRLSDRLFNFDAKPKALRKAELQLRALLTAAGVPSEKLGWDHYDNSVEIYQLPPDYRLSEDAQRVIHTSGFAKAYANHTDGWETHYSFHPQDAFKSAKGWRVSYPHKRGDDEKGILVEEVVPTWPIEWFDTGYCIVKPPIS